jgi:enterochelin esterase-like enzyme
MTFSRLNWLRLLSLRSVQWLASHGPRILSVLLAGLLVWGAWGEVHGVHDTALDYASRVLSILSVGQLTEKTNRILLAVWEVALALGILLPGGARLVLWLAWPKLLLALLPLVMLRGDLQASSQQTVLIYALLVGFIMLQNTALYWTQLQRDPDTVGMLQVEQISPQQKARRRKWILAVLGALLILSGIGRAAWPSYLRWFHARQEAAVLGEKLAGTLIRKSMPLSPLLHRKITTWVYLPPGYDRLNIHYPVVYVMHGMPGEVRDCFVKGQVHNAAEQLILKRKIRSVILVGWDGEGPTGPSDVTNFLDRANGSWSMESFLVRELVPYIDQTYRTIPKPEARALCGVSAGGYAAVNILFKHPDVWKTGASHTGFFDPSDDVENMTNILGPKGPLWDANNPMKTVGRITPSDNLHVYADIGQGDELNDEFSSFCATLQAKKIDHACHVFPGRHTWAFWSTHFYDSLQFIDASFEKMNVRE